MVGEDLNWRVKVHGRDLLNSHYIFNNIPPTVTDFEVLNKLITVISQCNICMGNTDPSFIELLQSRGGEIVKAFSFSCEKDVSAYIEEDLHAKAKDGKVYHSTIRTTNCLLIADKIRCTKCSSYRNNLRSLLSRRKSQDQVCKIQTGSRVNLRYLDKVQLKERAVNLQKEKIALKRTLDRTVKRLISDDGVFVEKSLQSDFKSIMEDNCGEVIKCFPEDSFQRLFWEEQLKHARCADSRQMRWHPTIIRWCLFLRFKSSTAYEALKNSGFVKLPSQRTLRDYSNYIKPEPGINHHVLKELVSEVNGKTNAVKYVALLHDELKIKQDLVYDKYTGELVGFINLGHINNELAKLEKYGNCKNTKGPELASHILVLMVRDLASNFQMSVSYHPTDSCRADHLFPIIWNTISYLEVSCGLHVLVSTSDGASWNRKFYRMHRVLGAPRDSLVFKCKNLFAFDGRYIYIVSDVPHLIKTTRNCWANSESHGKSRSLWNGNPILWRHLSKLVIDDQTRDIHLLHKIGYDHINITSFSIMRVNLAAQVLSETVANAIETYGPPDARETAKFVRYMDKFVDCLHVRCKEEYLRKKKPNLALYRNVNDPRLKWLEQDFLNYFTSWEEKISQWPGNFTKPQRSAMFISRQTMEGLKMTVKSFVETTKYLLNHGVQYFLSEKLCQDPLEAHFSNHRHRGGANNDPNVQAFGYQENAIRLQKSHHLQCVTGNTGRHNRVL
uniref:Uncharacterized protein LOC102801316 n=1 Tax=Saccoglossus kowalevskii TaxID=10224 RepID=A0ABM0M3D8_SACKO|nr:PREDICTED: uncharacterized protein LOC102801316 [Saccoglossus kowalevskii]